MAQTYTHNPRPVGGPVSFALNGDRLTVDTGRKVQEVRLGAVESVRLTYEPGRVGQRAFRTRVVMQDGKAFTFTSLNWRSFIEAQELTGEYRAFTQALCAAVASASPAARFIAGKPKWLWLAVVIVAAASLLGMAYLIWQALLMGSQGVALIGALLALVGIWQIEPMVRLNKPRTFRPDAVPGDLMPKAA